MDMHCTGKKDKRRAIWAGVTFMLWYEVFVQGVYDTQSFVAKKRSEEIKLIPAQKVI